MSEQGAERWEMLHLDDVPVLVKGDETIDPMLVYDYLNALEADLIALRTQLASAEAKAAIADELAGHLRYWLGEGWASTTRGVASHDVLDRLDALSRDTGSEEGKARILDAEDFWMNLTEQEQQWAREAVSEEGKG